jgi:hypothetical protein
MVICHDCRQPLADDDEVVAAVEQITLELHDGDVRTIDGGRVAAFHEHHWRDPADWA